MNTREEYREALQWVVEETLSFLRGLERAPVAATRTVDALLASLDPCVPAEGKAPLEVTQELVAKLRGGLMHTSGGRSFAWVIGGTLPAALAADWLTSAWDQNACLSACSPAAVAVEATAGAWLKELLGLPSRASFAFTTGCQMAHLTCLSAARHRLLDERGWDVERQGLTGAPPIRVLDVSYRHASIDRALRILGMGTDCIAEGSESKPSADTLARQLDASDTPTIVLMQAGDIHTGESDAFRELIPAAHARNAWVHVDGAFGLWARVSEAQRHHVAGVELADSWATDGHKWLNVPFDSGYAFVAHPAAHRGALADQHAPYVSSSSVVREPLDWTPEWSRRARGFATYAAIAQLGVPGVSRQIDEACRLARKLVQKLGRLPGIEVIGEPLLNQGLLRVTGDSKESEATRELLERLRRGGETFFQGSRWQGQPVIRVSVCSWQTTDRDVDRAVSAMRAVLGV